MPKVNFKDAQRDFDVLEPQTVEAELIKAEFFKTASGPNKGADNVKLEWKRDEGPDVESPNMHFFKNYSLLPQSVWNLRRDLEAMDCDPDILNDEDADVEDAIRDVMHHRCALAVGVEEYPSKELDEHGEPKTKQRNKVDAVMKV